MGEINCDVIQDLLPLYVDGELSESSRTLVDGHLEHCETCRAVRSNMEEEVPVKKTKVDAAVPLRQFKRRQMKKIILVVLIMLLPLLAMVVFLLRPFLWGFHSLTAEELIVTEGAEGSVLITLDEQAKGDPVLFCYEIRGKEQIVLYLLPAGVENQYFHKLYRLEKKMYDYVFEPYCIDVSGNSQAGRYHMSGGTNPVGGSFVFDQVGSILCPSSVDEIYFLPDCTENEWMEYVSYMDEEQHNLMENLVENSVFSEGKFLVTTDGYDFEQLGDKVLLWRKGTE